MTSPPNDSSDASGFAALGLNPALADGLAALGYEEPTPIQREAIPPLLAGKDVLGQAATGTGKTAAFALPLLHHIGPVSDGPRPVQALILVPTRELAMQVGEAVHKYGKPFHACVLPIYGGQPMQQQLRALKRGVDVVVATPGRAMDHIRRGTLDLGQVSIVVLDEADEMLDMGFAEDLEAILEATPAERQTALFSATLASRILAIARRHQREPVLVKIAAEEAASGETPRVREVAYVVPRQHKVNALGRILDMEAPASAMIFCRTRTEVDELTESLGGRGYGAEALHGGMSQEQRDRVMRRFRDGTAELLVATDVAARGLDIGHVSHVVNFDVPSSPDGYVHRIGRTGRAGREGVAITLAEPREHRFLRNIEQLTRRRIAIEGLPTIVDLRVRRLELARASLEEALVAGNLDEYRGVAASLSEEHDVLDIAAAAVKVADDALRGDSEEEEEIPRVALPERATRGEREDRRQRPDRRQPVAMARREGTAPFRADERRPRRRADARGAAADRQARVYVGIGRKAGIRPGDLVGAIANEAGIDARTIGAIDIADRYSLVEVPHDAVDDVIGALRATTIRGKRVVVRRDRES